MIKIPNSHSYYDQVDRNSVVVERPNMIFISQIFQRNYGSLEIPEMGSGTRLIKELTTKIKVKLYGLLVNLKMVLVCLTKMYKYILHIRNFQQSLI
jgi:hypothetical protein